MKQCHKCYSSFSSQGYLTRHLKKCNYNLENIVYTCQICNITYNNFNEIKEHSLICKIVKDNKKNTNKSTIVDNKNVNKLKEIIKLYENIIQTNLNIKINYELKENDLNIILDKPINNITLNNKNMFDNQIAINKSNKKNKKKKSVCYHKNIEKKKQMI